MGVIECENAEGALRVLAKMGDCVSMIFTDVELAGKIDGVELAHFARKRYPDIHVIVTSGRALTKSLPEGATFMRKPWLAFTAARGPAFTEAGTTYWITLRSAHLIAFAL